MKRLSMHAIAIALWCAVTVQAQQDIGTAFTYQGTLENASGPVTDTCDFRFGLWNDSAAGAQVGGSPLTVSAVDVVSGSFTAAIDFGAGAINGDARWLEIEVQCPGDAGFTLLSPRVELTPAPHATRAVSGVGPPNALEIDSATQQIGIGTNAPLYPLHVVGAINAQQPGSSPSGSHVRLGAPSSDPGQVMERGNGAGGVIKRYDIAVESDNSLEFRDTTAAVDRMVIDTTGRVGIGTITPGEQLTVAGTVHSTTGGFKFPDGSTQTTAAGGGGTGSTLDGAYDQGGPGAGRIITADAGAVEIQGSGGLAVAGTIQSGNSIVIDGTAYTVTSDDYLDMHVASGRALRLETNFSSPNLIGGHSSNAVTLGASGGTISGGGSNTTPNLVTDTYGTVGGGRDNQAGDGAGSTADRGFATVGGGSGNTASGAFSTVGGGTLNNATGSHSTIGGGANSTASGTYSSVGGGNTNAASGSRSTVPGGSSNTAGGDNSLAAGNRAKVRSAAQVGGGDTDGDQGTFVWGDSTAADFTSTGPNQFLIRAGGGVGIGTNTPSEALDVSGNIHADGTLASGNSITIDGIANTINSSGDLALQSTGGRVGVGTTTPGEQLTVAGTVHSTTGGFKFPDGSTQTTAVTSDDGIPQNSGVLRSGTTPVAGYTYTGDSLFIGRDLWTSETATPTEVYGAMVVFRKSVGLETLYSIGGFPGGTGAGTAVTTVLRSDNGGPWTSVAPLPHRLAFAGAAFAQTNQLIYVVGGSQHDDPGSPQETAAFLVYSQSTNTWTNLPATPQAAWGLGAAIIAPAHLYQVGGFEWDSDAIEHVGVAPVHRYDINTATWSQIADLPTPRGFLGVAEANGQIYAIGGRARAISPALDVVEIYDPATNTWREGTPIPIPAAEFAIAVDDDRIYCIGGISGNRYGTSASGLRTVQEYDTTRDQWTLRAPLPTPRGAASAISNGKREIKVLHGLESHSCEPDEPCVTEITNRVDSYETGRKLYIHFKD